MGQAVAISAGEEAECLCVYNFSQGFEKSLNLGETKCSQEVGGNGPNHGLESFKQYHMDSAVQ